MNGISIVRRIVVALCLLQLSACFTYQPKVGEPIAKLRFVTYSHDVSSISMQDMSACPARERMIYQQISGLFPHSPSRVGMASDPDPLARAFEEMIVPANRKAVMVVTSGRAAVPDVPGYNCEVGVSFDIRADRQYELQYRYENKACSVRVYEVKVSPSAIVTRVPEPSARAFRARLGDNLCAFR